MLYLSTRAAAAFDPAIRNRGAAYARGHRVRVTRATADEVEATVAGSSTYRVHLDADNGQLFVSCTCPYVEDHVDPCKHIWATILKAEAAGSLGSLAQGRGPLGVELEPYDGDGHDDNDGDGDGDDDDDEGGASDWPGAVGSYAALGYSAARPASAAGRAPAGAARPTWRDLVAKVEAARRGAATRQAGGATAREIAYVVDVAKSVEADGLALEIIERSPKRNGEPGAWKALALKSARGAAELAEPSDRRLLSLFTGVERTDAAPAYAYAPSYGYEPGVPSRFVVRALAADALVPELCATGRFFVRGGDVAPTPGGPGAAAPRGTGAAAPQGAGAAATRGGGPKDPPGAPLAWDDGPPWSLRLRLEQAPVGSQVELRGVLERGEQRAELGDARLALGGPGGVVVLGDRAARFDDRGASAWVSALRAYGPLRAPRHEQEKLAAAVLEAPSAPPLDLPEGPLDEVRAPLAPAVSVRAAKRSAYAAPGAPAKLHGEARFTYDGAGVPATRPGSFVPDLPRRRLLVRDAAAERAALGQLAQAGFVAPRHEYHALAAPEGTFELAPSHLPAAVRALTEAGWRVEAEGKLYRRPGEFTLRAGEGTGVDWFELKGGIAFGDRHASLPALLAALDRADHTVVLDDGSLGLVPEAWLEQWAPVLRLGESKGGGVTYRASQAGLLDALLATSQEGAGEATIARVRARLPQFAAATEAAAPAGFVGELRPYQRQGLGWLLFLERAGLGGCLADDMGLGKTVQVLALLERLRSRRPRRPSLAVVPRSLLFNWQREAARFAPKLKVLAHVGPGRSTAAEHLTGFDLVLTTYGTLRRDAAALSRHEFRYVILDEAQAIKNAASDAAKAARLLRAEHRLALSGTPVENHLGELWSLFEFLNPGMLGRASAFKGLVKDARSLDEGARPLVRALLRPVLLRRTKAEVARDLPAKVEETIACELGPRERREYDALRDHFRKALLERVKREGMARAKIHVLEALLRLRQAACHPGLLDPKRRGEPSAKLDELLERLTEVLDGGHKALVFSQFTSLLAIVRARLVAAKIDHAYLDGKTRDREAQVERFQTDPACPVFLVSLKAGGVGLNLTAAEYVFLLDPWWNPAVEAQAVDRSHRIGQTRAVFAYRLLARGTVEEKVAELQAQKRALADAILEGEGSPLGELTREDLERLLS